MFESKQGKQVLEKFLSCGSQPANFQAFVKDHKANSERGFPLQPIASVKNTATEKVDWLVTMLLSIKDCPMWSHFAPPFVVITVHYVENLALEKLQNELSFPPVIYYRFIDDCLLGPIDNEDTGKKIVSIFNSVNENIQLTLDFPKQGAPVNILEISNKVLNKNVEFWWCT